MRRTPRAGLYNFLTIIFLLLTIAVIVLVVMQLVNR